jgi:hypothetical protein
MQTRGDLSDLPRLKGSGEPVVGRTRCLEAQGGRSHCDNIDPPDIAP